MTAAPRKMPLQPYSPNLPVLGGMKGCQLAELTNAAPTTMTAMTTATLTTTMTLLTVADSRIPVTSKLVTASEIATAGRLKTAVTLSPPATGTRVPGAALKAAGNCKPRSCRMLVRKPDQPTATVAAPRAYSR